MINTSENLEQLSFLELGPIAERFDQQVLQSWALQRIYHIQSTDPDNCLAELQQIAEWVQKCHTNWMKDEYWAEYVRINARSKRTHSWLRFLKL